MSKESGSFPEFAPRVRADILRQTREEIAEYEVLTIGCPDEHLSALRMATNLGGSTMIAVRLAGDSAPTRQVQVTGQYELSFET